MNNEFSNRKLRIVEFNVENLFILDNPLLPRSLIENKPVTHVQHIARTILDIDPDILLLCEVGGLESLESFNHRYLNSLYTPYLLEGNSNRGIDIGYLVKRSLPFSYKLISHKERPLDFLYPHERQGELSYEDIVKPPIVHRFSRDVLELRVFEKLSEDPVLIVLLVHLKSQLDREGIDPGGRDRRRAELEKVTKIYLEVDAEFHGRVPVILGGDFNGSAAAGQVDPEFEALYRNTHLQDALEIAQIPVGERFTHMQLSGNRQGYCRQLDYIFVPPSLIARVNREETWVFRFKDANGTTMILPRNLNEKRLLPSDHYPVILTLDPT